MEETQEPTSIGAQETEAPPTEPADQPAPLVGPTAAPTGKRDIGKIVAISLVVGAFLIVIAAAMYGLVTNPDIASVLRDISIIVLALVTIITGLFLAVLIFQVQSLIVLLRDEIYPILNSINQTADTVRGTTTFVSDTVVTPVISAASYLSAIRQTVSLLAGRPSKSKKPPQARVQE